MAEKALRFWRCFKAEDHHGWFVWFDPETELLTLRDLTEDEKSDTLDKLGSVSDLSPPRVSLGDQMDAFGGSDVSEPPPLFLESLWEGGGYDHG